MNKFIVFIKKHKVAIISTIVFWLFAEAFVVAPIASTIVDSSVSGTFDLTYFFEHAVESIVNVDGIKKVFGANYIGTFVKSTLFFSIIFGIALGIGLYKGRKRGKYDKIEHGSSDWCEGRRTI